MRIVTAPQAAVEAGAVQADAVISISSSFMSPPRISAARHPLGVMRLRFEDVLETRADARGTIHRPPTRQHVAAAISFARRVRAADPDGRLVVHCRIGISRSPALAIVLMADVLGAGREAEAVAEVIAASRPDCLPHWGIIAHGEAELGLKPGALAEPIETALLDRARKWRSSRKPVQGLGAAMMEVPT